MDLLTLHMLLHAHEKCYNLRKVIRTLNSKTFKNLSDIQIIISTVIMPFKHEIDGNKGHGLLLD